MAYIPSNLVDAVLTGSLVAQYTVPAGTRALLKAAVLCNTTAGVVACTVQLTPGTAGTARTVISARNIAVGESYSCPEVSNHVLEPGGIITAMGNGVTMMCSGVEVVI